MPSPRLVWLRVHAYPGIAPGTFVEFGSDRTVVLGPNGSGKSTLLRLVRQVMTEGWGHGWRPCPARGGLGPLDPHPPDAPLHLEYGARATSDGPVTSVTVRHPGDPAFAPQECPQTFEQARAVLARDPAGLGPVPLRGSALGAFLDLTGHAGGTVLDVPRPTPAAHINVPGGPVPLCELSAGEQRLFALLWHLHLDRGPIVADDLADGFAPAWANAVADRLTDGRLSRQVFLASHNPHLIDGLDPGDPSDPSDPYARFVRCERTPAGVTWRNLTAEEETRIAAAYDRHTRYLHEILRGEGLW